MSWRLKSSLHTQFRDEKKPKVHEKSNKSKVHSPRPNASSAMQYSTVLKSKVVM